MYVTTVNFNGNVLSVSVKAVVIGFDEQLSAVYTYFFAFNSFIRISYIYLTIFYAYFLYRVKSVIVA